MFAREIAMSFDLLSTIELTASAALVIDVLAFTLAATRRGRIEAAALLAVWFAFVVFLGATRVLNVGPPPALAAAVILPVVALCVAFFYSPSIKAAAMAMPLPALEAVHAARILGISFVLLYAAGRLPAPFAPIAGWGDILVGVAALPVAWAMSRFGARMRRLALVWNALGLLDLVTAIGLGATSAPGPIQIFTGPPDSAIMTTLPWLLIPAFLVPSYMFFHIVIFYRLTRRSASTIANPTSGADARGGAQAVGAFSRLYRVFAHMSA
jgi:hypothetical protein